MGRAWWGKFFKKRREEKREGEKGEKGKGERGREKGERNQLLQSWSL